ncbi:MAG TPA: response regulator [Cyclobacteriaceae bacterium]|jgi:two-component system response regulator|nr:response regulator [Cyclobacteriaceae bacterium]
MEKDDLIDVLLVEDNPDDTELTTHALTEGNKALHLLHLKDGVEALNFIFNKKSDENRKIQNTLRVVLLDLKLPRLDGLEVLRKIREDERTRTLPVVILTSSREKRDIAEAYKLGVNSYVVKPVGFDSYVKTISSLAVYWSLLNEKPI